MFKTLIEYKANFYSMFIEQFFYILTDIAFFLLFGSLFSDIIGWEIVDFVIFAILVDFFRAFPGIFAWGKGVSENIKNGNFNNNLNKPLNPFLKHYFSDLSSVGIFYIITNLISFFFIIYYFEIQVNNIFMLLIVMILILIVGILFNLFYQSLGFIVLDIDSNVLDPIFQSMYGIVNQYPAQYFTRTKLVYVIFIIPAAFIGSLFIPLMRNYEIWNINYQLTILVILIIFFIIGTIFNWSYGLKKYEAFG